MRKAEGLLQLLVDLAQPKASQGTSDTSRLMAVRALAVLGESLGCCPLLGETNIWLQVFVRLSLAIYPLQPAQARTNRSDWLSGPRPLRGGG